MKRFYKNIILLFIINCGIFFVLLFVIHIFFVWKHWQTDYDVFIMPDNKQYQFVILGTSHSQNFTRFGNQQLVEKILGKHFFNLSQPNAGPLMEKIYLQLFLEKGNTTHTVVYFIDPQVFYTSQDNENYNVLPLYGEINFPLLTLLIQNKVDYATILSYIKTNLSFKWIIKNPRPSLPSLNVYTPNSQIDKQRLLMLYPDGINDETFNRYTTILNDLLLICHEDHIKLIFVILPTKIEKYPGMDKLKLLLKQYKQKYDIPYYDYSHAITDNSLYSNVDHLNSKGIKVFTKKYLKGNF